MVEPQRYHFNLLLVNFFKDRRFSGIKVFKYNNFLDYFCRLNSQVTFIKYPLLNIINFRREKMDISMILDQAMLLSVLL